MTKQTVRVRVLKNNLPKVTNYLEPETKRISWEIANQIFELAQATVPYKTGALHDSGSIRGTAQGYNVGYDIYYAPLVHDGTAKMEARPWLQIAANQIMPIFMAEVSKFRGNIEKVAQG